MSAAINTTRTLEIRQSPWEMLKMLAIGIGFVATSVFIYYQGSVLYIVIGIFGIVFFGALTLFVLWRLLTQMGPVVTVSPAGVRDKRIAADMVPWSAITDISTWSAYNQPAIVLAVRPEVEKRLRLSLMARVTRRANASLGADGLAIASQGLGMGHDELLDTLTAYWERAGGGVR
jgi:hypothetical protein